MTNQDRALYNPNMTDEQYVMWFVTRAGYCVRMVNSEAFGFNRVWATRLHDAATFDLPVAAMNELIGRGAVVCIANQYFEAK